MLRLSLFLIALAGFGALVALPDTSPRATLPADTSSALVYGTQAPPASQPQARARPPVRPTAALGAFLSETMRREESDANDDLLTITTADGEVIRIAAEVPPGMIRDSLIRIEADDRHAEARRLEEANARARDAVAAVTRAAADPELPPDVVYATGAYINLRSGPSTYYPAVGYMNYGMAAERLEALATGWTRIRILETGQEGYMSSAFLLKSPATIIFAPG